MFLKATNGTLGNMCCCPIYYRIGELELEGVRFIYRGNNNTFAHDIEPEYIAFNKDETKAYVCLQVKTEFYPALFMSPSRH